MLQLRRATLRVFDAIQETPDATAFRLDSAEAGIASHKPGPFVNVCVEENGKDVRRSFTISSSPAQA